MGKGIRIGAAVGIVGFLWSAWNGYKNAKVPGLVQVMSGYNMNTGDWDVKEATALVPLAVGVGVSIVASKVGANRYTPKGVNI